MSKRDISYCYAADFGWRPFHGVGLAAGCLSIGEDGGVDAAQNIADDWLCCLTIHQGLIRRWLLVQRIYPFIVPLICRIAKPEMQIAKSSNPFHAIPFFRCHAIHQRLM